MVESLEHSALALLSAGENKLGHASALAVLLGTDVDQTASDGSTVIAANAVGSVRAVDGVVAGSLLGSLALRSNGAIGNSTKATDARPSRKATASTAANAVRVIVR